MGIITIKKLLLIFYFLIGYLLLAEEFENIIIKENFENCLVNDFWWESIGNSGPEGKSFSGVTEKTASPFENGWKSYEIRIGNGGSLREKYFWMNKPIYLDLKKGGLFFSFDFMGSDYIEEGGFSFEFLGGDDGWKKLFMIGVNRKKITWTKITGNIVDEIKPFVWYRIELNFKVDENKLFGNLKLIEYKKDNLIIQKEVVIPKYFNNLNRLKIAMWRNNEKGHIFSFYIDNIQLRVISN